MLYHLIEQAGPVRPAPVEDGAEAAGAVRGLVVGRRQRGRAAARAAAAHARAARQVRRRVRAADVAHHLTEITRQFITICSYSRRYSAKLVN